MRIRKFDRYCDGLEGCVEEFKRARRAGVLLTDTELLDYYFKYSLVSGRVKKGDIGFLAAFYAEYLEEVFDLRTIGYSNKSMMDLLKRVCFRGRLNGISKIKVSGHDINGVFYVKVKNCRSGEVNELEVKDIRSFTNTCLAVITLVATDGLEDGELKSFAQKYLLGVYKDIASSSNPKPYIYNGASKSFKAYVAVEASKVKKSRKVIQFKVG